MPEPCSSRRQYANSVFGSKAWPERYPLVFQIGSPHLLQLLQLICRKIYNYALYTSLFVLTLSLAACSQDSEQTKNSEISKEHDASSRLSIVDSVTNFSTDGLDGAGEYFDHSPYTFNSVDFRYACCFYENRVYLFCLYEVESSFGVGIFRYDLSENGLYRSPEYLDAEIRIDHSDGCDIVCDAIDIALPWSPDSDQVVISIKNEKEIKVNGLEAELLNLSLSQIDEAMREYIEHQRNASHSNHDVDMGLFYEITFYSGSLLVDGKLISMSIAERVRRDVEAIRHLSDSDVDEE